MIRQGFIAEWELAIAMLRWDHLKDEYAKAQRRHSGQARAAKALREFTAGLMRAGT